MVTWKDFKDWVEGQGVTDYTKVVEIRWKDSDLQPQVHVESVRID